MHAHEDNVYNLQIGVFIDDLASVFMNLIIIMLSARFRTGCNLFYCLKTLICYYIFIFLDDQSLVLLSTPWKVYIPDPKTNLKVVCSSSKYVTLEFIMFSYLNCSVNVSILYLPESIAFDQFMC